MRLLVSLATVASILPLATPRVADEAMYSGPCRTLPIQLGKNICAYCDWQSTPLNCNFKSQYTMCLDKKIPNPCYANEVLLLSARNSVENFKDPVCSNVCPGKRCFTSTLTYKDTCCGCPSGWRAKIPGPYCTNGVGIGSTQFCVGCKGAGEKLSWNATQKGWECLPGR